MFSLVRVFGRARFSRAERWKRRSIDGSAERCPTKSCHKWTRVLKSLVGEKARGRLDLPNAIAVRHTNPFCDREF